MPSLVSCLLLLAASADALVLSGVRPVLAAPRVAQPPTMQLFGLGKPPKSAEELLEEKGYWPGEWVCADCGYVYEPGTVPPFEELRPRWKCPQCAGPRRRFVKKAGDQYGSLDDSPLLIGTAAFAVATVVLVYLGLT